ncbi:MAG: LamG-like jellyroll fold domain-containing protein [Acidimicrobiales bacterium]
MATGTDIASGRIATSPWSDWGVTSWSPPSGTFQDGGIYTWRVQARDEYGAIGSWSSTQTFKVDFRLGMHAALPFDTHGPVTVNLATGNLVVQAGGPSFDTVGGPIGVSFTYNSQAPALRGLTGDYYQDVNRDGDWDSASEPRPLHRIDPQLTFNWGGTGPADGPNPGVIAPEWWGATWKGSLVVPSTSGTYTFISDTTDDTIKVTLGNDVVLNTTGCCQRVEGTPKSLTAGTIHTVRIDYWQGPGGANMRLKVRDPNGAEYDVPAEWLLPDEPTLPGGWSRAGEALGTAAYSSLRPLSGSVTVVVDATGADHMYRRSGDGWQPPPGEDGHLTQRPDGSWSLLGEDGQLYVFDAEGHLTEIDAAGQPKPGRPISSATDDVNPGAPVYSYTRPNPGGPFRLTQITDAANRSLALTYGGQAGCPTASGFSSPPTHMLCKVAYTGFGGGTTDLLYKSGHLARIVNPGAETTDFGYDAAGRLTSIRSPLTNDLIGPGGPITDGYLADGVTPNPAHLTLIGYTSGKVTSVELPTPASGAPRPRRTYDYGNGTTTKMFVAGLLTDATKPARQVTLDAAGHAVDDIDAAGFLTHHDWDINNDRITKTTRGPNGHAAPLQTTFIYDAAGRLTDTYGPAPASEFSGATSATAPRSTTAYDEAINGLGAAWFDNQNLAGLPRSHSTSGLAENWGSGSPSAVPGDRFSGRLTGEVTMPSAGTLTVDADGARVFVDEQKVLDTWGGPYSGAVRADSPRGYWRLGEKSATPWTKLGYPDAAWPAVTDEGTYGVGPWWSNVSGWPDSSARWIWDRNATSSAPVGNVFFRRSFNVATTTTANVSVAADNSHTTYLDGVPMSSGSDWMTTQTVQVTLTPGDHQIAIKAANGGTSDNPAGILATVRRTDGSVIVRSDSAWKVAGYPNPEPGLDTLAADQGTTGAGVYSTGVSLDQAGATSSDEDRSASFNGVDSSLRLSDGLADFTNGLTLEAWVYPTSVGRYQRIFDLGRGQGQDNIILSRLDTTNSLYFGVHRGGTDQWFSVPNAIELNRWQHFAVTLTASGTATIYKDGASLGSASIWLPNNIVRTSNLIGSSNWGTMFPSPAVSTSLRSTPLLCRSRASRRM